MIRKSFGVFLTVLMSTLATGAAVAQECEEATGKMIMNGDLNATITCAEGEQDVGGRMSAVLSIAYGGAKLQVEDFNIVLFRASQALITGKATKGKPTGVVGFAINAGEDSMLVYDAKSRTLSGELSGRVDIPQLLELARHEVDPEQDEVDIPTMPAVVKVTLVLSEALDQEAACEDMLQVKAQVVLAFDVQGLAEVDVAGFRILARGDWILSDYTYGPIMEVSRDLCLQPVRIGMIKLPPPPSLSGDGLAFGLPGAYAEWGKADVSFTVRSWITLYKPSYSTLSEAEAYALSAEVDVDDCVEVYFPDRFDPSSLFGGGITFSAGTASAKVVTSDENADFGIDLTHLAHELGHALALKHPGSGSSTTEPYMVAASTGTLMCPSGFLNDNPQVNSEWNEDHISNPLITFSFKEVDPKPDCVDDTDCGPCIW